MVALSNEVNKFAGLGDCFCLTDPSVADNPIMFASDGFVSVTGYSRKDIVQRNCRFLQGTKTDRSSVQRLKTSIDNNQDSVELVLNYRKDGTPFWNLLYVAPLLDETGEVKLFLGGQIDCSSTIDNDDEALKVLGCTEMKTYDQRVSEHNGLAVRPGQERENSLKPHRHLWKPSPLPRKSDANLHDLVHHPSLERELLGDFHNVAFDAQVERFRTAYSKVHRMCVHLLQHHAHSVQYIILTYSSRTSAMSIAHYSPALFDYMGVDDQKQRLFHRDVFDLLSRLPSSWSQSEWRTYKHSVKEHIAKGRAVSLDFVLSPKLEANGPTIRSRASPPTEVRYVSHWTPCKDVQGTTAYVTLIIAPSHSSRR